MTTLATAEGRRWGAARPLGRALSQARLDLSTLLAGLTAGLAGRRPPPLVPRREAEPGRWASGPATARAARTLRVARVEAASASAVALTLEDPTGRPIDFLPGQFFTLLVPVGGGIERRAYSATTHYRDTSRVGLVVKRVEGGLVSPYLCDRVAAGSLLRVLGPSGSFAVEPDPTAERNLVLLGGGSGITPLLAIARAVLSEEPLSRVALVYGNRRLEEVILRGALEALAAASSGRFVVRHVLEEPAEGFECGEGRLDAEGVARELDGLRLPEGRATTYLLCGPPPMMAAARRVLEERGVPAELIREERFSQPRLRTGGPLGSSRPERVTVRRSGAERAVTVRPGESILDASLAAGVPLPFSCAMGGCGTCRVTLAEGEVQMAEPTCLSPAEREAGQVLTCVGHPRGPVVIEVDR